jgi:hypothetical protein
MGADLGIKFEFQFGKQILPFQLRMQTIDNKAESPFITMIAKTGNGVGKIRVRQVWHGGQEMAFQGSRVFFVIHNFLQNIRFNISLSHDNNTWICQETMKEVNVLKVFPGEPVKG